MQRAELEVAVIRAIREMIASATLFNQQAADQLGIHPTDLQLLNILELNGPLTPGTLTGMTGLTSGGITVALDRLERQGHVVRARNPKDRRSVLVRFTGTNNGALTGFYRAMQEKTEDALSGFTADELDAALSVLRALGGIDRT